MKIIQITPSYKPAYIYGGPTQSVGKLCETLSSIDNIPEDGRKYVYSKASALEVLTTTANGRKELDVQSGQSVVVDGVSVTYFTRWTKDHSHFSPGLLWRLRARFKNAEPCNTVVHIHAWWNLVSILTCAMAKWYRFPVVLSPRGMLNRHTYSSGNKMIKRVIHFTIGKKLLRYCTIHVTTNREQIDATNFLNTKVVTVIPNLVEIPAMMPKPSIELSTTTSFRIVFFSRLDPIKGIELLLQSLSETTLPWKLTIAGTGDEDYVQSLQQKAEMLDISHKIKWLGHVNNEDKYQLIAAHDLLVLPSYSENFANVVIESLSVGTPVLVSDKVGLADYILEKNLGWVTSLDIKEIGNKLTAAAEDKLKRNAIRAVAPGQIREDFNDEFLARRYLALYESVIGETQPKN